MNDVPPAIVLAAILVVGLAVLVGASRIGGPEAGPALPGSADPMAQALGSLAQGSYGIAPVGAPPQGRDNAFAQVPANTFAQAPQHTQVPAPPGADLYAQAGQGAYAPPPANGFAPAPGSFAPPGGDAFAPSRGNAYALAPGTPRARSAQPPSGWGQPPAPQVDPRRFTEAHWQGLEVVPNTPALARALNIDPALRGVIVDDVTLPADLQGFQAGDVVTGIDGMPTPDLLSFIRASDQARSAPSAVVQVTRGGQPGTVQLVALLNRMGTANGETPSMIPANARMPHAYRGPCVNCHRIGTTGSLRVDQGDPMPNVTAAPMIRAGARRPHVDRGPCETCHTILP
ncbi:MAG: hypothetical protein DRJ42_16655 [Deltaproteobacteria bacterium]|nr:MAG: hypothetical protein DRJ42_16655 [Deltaproteobacteria bacterium]